MRKVKKQKVFVGMSGGVDSSVSAALLKKAGYDVTGVFIRVWEPEGIKCTWREDRRDAMRVAAILNIPFVTIDLSKEYKKEVVDYMVREYKAGRTPNPDVMCNKAVKFGAFYNWAMAQGADFVATGHYAQTKDGRLLNAKDQEKDQTYFLWTLTGEQLKHTMFPIGGYKKAEVRKLAEKFKLPTAQKKDSQGLCFIGKLDFAEFLKGFIKSKKGKVLNEKGEIIGWHDGATFLTLGQRHGFTVDHKAADDKPLYIIAKDIKKNTVIVSPDWSESIGVRPEITVSNLNLTGTPTKNLKCRLRYRQSLISCKIDKITPDGCSVVFAEPQIATPGQSIVFYDNQKCLGGAIIE